jgi:hypothetical protein
MTARISEVTIYGGPGPITAPEEEATAFIVRLGGGMEIATSQHAALFVLSGYTSLFTKNENTAYLPIRGGLKLSQW